MVVWCAEGALKAAGASAWPGGRLCGLAYRAVASSPDRALPVPSAQGRGAGRGGTRRLDGAPDCRRYCSCSSSVRSIVGTTKAVMAMRTMRAPPHSFIFLLCADQCVVARFLRQAWRRAAPGPSSSRRFSAATSSSRASFSRLSAAVSGSSGRASAGDPAETRRSGRRAGAAACSAWRSGRGPRLAWGSREWCSCSWGVGG